MKPFNKQKNKASATIAKQGGFTLIEIMVATSIFMIIMLVAMGALVSSSDAAKKSEALRSAMDNVNFALESMTRSLRMGSDYSCINGNFSLPAGAKPDCPLSGGGGAAIAFTPANTDITKTPARNAAFSWVTRPDGLTHTIEKCTPLCTDLVSSDIDITKLTFYVTGSSPTDNIQPSVYIVMKGDVVIKNVHNVFAIQTMASQRSAE